MIRISLSLAQAGLFCLVLPPFQARVWLNGLTGFSKIRDDSYAGLNAIGITMNLPASPSSTRAQSQ
jgi:hypothetical protein